MVKCLIYRLNEVKVGFNGQEKAKEINSQFYVRYVKLDGPSNKP